MPTKLASESKGNNFLLGMLDFRLELDPGYTKTSHHETLWISLVLEVEVVGGATLHLMCVHVSVQEKWVGDIKLQDYLSVSFIYYYVFEFSWYRIGGFILIFMVMHFGVSWQEGDLSRSCSSTFLIHWYLFSCLLGSSKILCVS